MANEVAVRHGPMLLLAGPVEGRSGGSRTGAGPCDSAAERVLRTRRELVIIVAFRSSGRASGRREDGPIMEERNQPGDPRSRGARRGRGRSPPAGHQRLDRGALGVGRADRHGLVLPPGRRPAGRRLDPAPADLGRRPGPPPPRRRRRTSRRLALAADRGGSSTRHSASAWPPATAGSASAGRPPAATGPAVTLAGSIQDIDELRRDPGPQRLSRRHRRLVGGRDHRPRLATAVIIAWNGGAARLFGREADEVLGQPVASLAPWVRLDLAARPAAPGPPGRGRHRARSSTTAEGRRPAGAGPDARPRSATPAARSSAPRSSLRDVTGRRAMERRLVSAGRDLRRRSDELEQFVYTVSHDLKSPLVTCTGYVGLLEEDLQAGDSEAAVDSARRVRNAVTKMSRLIDDLLELSRIGRPTRRRPQRLDLPRLVAELAEVDAPPLRGAGRPARRSPPSCPRPSMPTSATCPGPWRTCSRTP